MDNEFDEYNQHQENIETSASNVKELINLILINIENLDLSKRTDHSNLDHEYLCRVKEYLTKVNSDMEKINNGTFDDSINKYYSSSMNC